jgi:hypothetical protein
MSAQQGLRLNDVNSANRVQYLPIASDGLFKRLWETGLFHEINRTCGTLVDDYEEDFVGASSITGLMAAVEAIAEKEKGATPDVKDFFMELHKLAANALSQKRPVLFVL